ncbi:MAG: tRNA (adenosine(37)-N6)-threonylcarbamoyltransferase complex ATPase subunit type 1 TsaE [Patescibacteria group bacterium]
MIKITISEKETFKLAKRFAKSLKGGEVVALYGDLGAGKTVFVRGLAAGLGVKDIVKSPTFVIMKCFRGEKLNLCHIDAYRLQTGVELEDIGAMDFFGKPKVVTVIEWAERIPELLEKPAKIIKVRIEHLKKEKLKIII